jgi:hypothetical protein
MAKNFVVWKWGDRYVNYGRVVSDDEHVLLTEVVDIEGERHQLALPKKSFKFKFFNTEKEAKEFLVS